MPCSNQETTIYEGDRPLFAIITLKKHEDDPLRFRVGGAKITDSLITFQPPRAGAGWRLKVFPMSDVLELTFYEEL